MNWYLKVLKHYADFNGRASRKEYWMFNLFNLGFSIIILMIGKSILAYSNSPELVSRYQYTLERIGLDPLYTGYIVLTFIPSLAVGVRRLHDVGKSGWMMLVSLIPFIGGIWLLFLLVTKGNAEENKYGLNPFPL